MELKEGRAEAFERVKEVKTITDSRSLICRVVLFERTFRLLRDEAMIGSC